MRLLVPAGSMDGRYLFFVTRNCDPVFLEGSANYARHRPPSVSGTVVLKNVFIFRTQSDCTDVWTRLKRGGGGDENEGTGKADDTQKSGRKILIPLSAPEEFNFSLLARRFPSSSSLCMIHRSVAMNIRKRCWFASVLYFQ